MCNDFRSAKALRITYSECVFVASGIQQAMRMNHTVIIFIDISNHIQHTPCSVRLEMSKHIMNVTQTGRVH